MEITDLWRKSVPTPDGAWNGYRVLMQCGNAIFAARSIGFSYSMMDFVFLRFNGDAYVENKNLGHYYIQAKEAYALHILLDCVSLAPEDEEAKKKSDVFNDYLKKLEDEVYENTDKY
jgi:hypothetical protein